MVPEKIIDSLHHMGGGVLVILAVLLVAYLGVAFYAEQEKCR